jgi:hypothetical protein
MGEADCGFPGNEDSFSEVATSLSGYEAVIRFDDARRGLKPRPFKARKIQDENLQP